MAADIDALTKEKTDITNKIDSLSIQHDTVQSKVTSSLLQKMFTLILVADLTKMYQSQTDLEKLLMDTENSYTKIFESIKTLLTVVKKQQKTLVDR